MGTAGPSPALGWRLPLERVTRSVWVGVRVRVFVSVGVSVGVRGVL